MKQNSKKKTTKEKGDITMKNIFYASLVMLATVFMASCNSKKSNTLADKTDTESENTECDSTVYGICGDGTSMNSLQLITDKGDTLTYTMIDADEETNVKGGLLSGDHLAVTAVKTEDGEMFAQSVINLTSLLGKWSSIDRSFTIKEGGTVDGDNQEPRPYVDWRILNGKLLLSADTFSIYSLGPDSLLLENRDGIYSYKRVLK